MNRILYLVFGIVAVVALAGGLIYSRGMDLPNLLSAAATETPTTTPGPTRPPAPTRTPTATAVPLSYFCLPAQQPTTTGAASVTGIRCDPITPLPATPTSDPRTPTAAMPTATATVAITTTPSSPASGTVCPCPSPTATSTPIQACPCPAVTVVPYGTCVVCMPCQVACPTPTSSTTATSTPTRAPTSTSTPTATATPTLMVITATPCVIICQLVSPTPITSIELPDCVQVQGVGILQTTSLSPQVREFVAEAIRSGNASEVSCPNQRG